MMSLYILFFIIFAKGCFATCKFENVYQLGSYDSNNYNFKMDTITLNDASELVTLSVDPPSYNEFFQFNIINSNTNPKQIKMSLKKPMHIFKGPLERFRLIATDGTDTSSIDIILDIVQRLPEHKSLMSFEYDTYEGRYALGALKLDNAIKVLTINKEQKKFNLRKIDVPDGVVITPSYVEDTQEVSLQITGDLSKIDSFIVFGLRIDAASASAYTSVIIQVEQSQSLRDTRKIIFDDFERLQTVTIDELPFTGVHIVARADGWQDQSIRYEIDAAYRKPHIELGAETGVLLLDAGLSPDVYVLKIRAARKEEEEPAVTKLIIVVRKHVEDDTKEPVPFSRVYHKVFEGGRTTKLVYGTYVNNVPYSYCLESMHPFVPSILKFEPRGVSVDESTIDYDADYFRSFRTPQFTAVLRAVPWADIPLSGLCHNPRAFFVDSEPILASVNSRFTMTIVLPVEDDNDNAPTVPSYEESNELCYPNEDLYPYIRPPYLMHIHAVDVDIDDRIKYSISPIADDKLYISVNAITGVVYPTSLLFNRSSANVRDFVEVYASDERLNRVEIAIQPRIVDKDHVGVLRVEGTQFEAIDAFLREISDETVKIRRMSFGGMYENINNATGEESRSTDIIVCGIKKRRALSYTDLQEWFNDKGGFVFSEFKI